MKNWKTTLFGSVGAICAALAASFPKYSVYFGTAATISGILFAAFCKDNNVTGGTTQQ